MENTYLSTFQSLGALGLVLGTVGLATVLLRNVLERRKELALLRAVGYRRLVLSVIIVSENMLLVTAGLACGAVCASLAILPALTARGVDFPCRDGRPGPGGRSARRPRGLRGGSPRGPKIPAPGRPSDRINRIYRIFYSKKEILLILLILSKDQFQPELDAPGAGCGRYPPEGGRSPEDVRQVEIRPVECVEKLRAELEAAGLPYP